jgi:hypothetical protein
MLLQQEVILLLLVQLLVILLLLLLLVPPICSAWHNLTVIYTPTTTESDPGYAVAARL